MDNSTSIWVEKEFSTINFNDKRLVSRFKKIFLNLSAKINLTSKYFVLYILSYFLLFTLQDKISFFNQGSAHK